MTLWQEYHLPTTVNDALSLMQRYDGQALFVAGGTDLMLDLEYGNHPPVAALVDVTKIAGLNEIREEGDWILIGAAVTHAQIESDPRIRRYGAALAESSSVVGGPQVRNVATIGGNLVNAVPSADGAIPLIVLDAGVNIYGTKGMRSLDLVHFFLGPGQTVLEKGEILTEIVVPPLLPRTASAYVKFGRRKAMELPLLGVGVLLSLEEDMHTCAKVRIGLGVAAPTPMRAFGAERYLKGKPVTEETLAEAGSIAAEEARVRDSIRGVAWYRRELVGVLVRRMGTKCMERIRVAADG
jgi:carbon-monoxide dehydrogenase medium subunit